MVGLCCYLCLFIDGNVVILMSIKHAFPHNKMPSVQFNFQKPSDISTLDIEGIDIFFNLTKAGT